jgi:hypothetical protein
MRPRRLPRWIWTALAGLLCVLPIGHGEARPIFVTGAGQGGGPHVQVFDAATGALLVGFFAYDPAFTGGVRVAAADVNGDGVPDVITAPGPGGGPHVRVFDGAALQAGQVVEVVGFFAYNPAFTGGVYIGAATGTACPPSMVLSGPTCIDKYEASVWETTNAAAIAKIQAGTVTLAELQAGDPADRRLRDLPDHGQRLRERLRGLHPRGDAVAESDLVSGGGGGAERGEAVAVERGVAGGGARHSGRVSMQRGWLGCRPDGYGGVRVGRGGVRHGGEPLRIRGRLGAAVYGLRGGPVRDGRQ